MLTIIKSWQVKIVAAVALAAMLSVGCGPRGTSVIDDSGTFANYNMDENKLLTKLGYTQELVAGVLSNRTTFSQDNENITQIIESLPLPDYRKYNSFSLVSEPSKQINIAYEFDDHYNLGGNGMNPYYETVEENNALLLFASVDGIEQVNFLSYDDFNNKELNRTDSYTMDDLILRFGNIIPSSMSVLDLYSALSPKMYLSEAYFAHYSRIYLGAVQQHVSYRNDEPDEIRRQPDGSTVWLYSNFGLVYNMSPDGYIDPENKAVYYFDSPQAERDVNLIGLYATRFIHHENYGKTYDEVAEVLGYPSIFKDLDGGDKYMAYPLIAEYENINAYFILHNDKVIEEGIMYGDDYAMLNLEQSELVLRNQSREAKSSLTPATFTMPMDGDDSYNRVYELSPTPVAISDDSMFSTLEMSDGTKVCWYLDGADKSCAYRKPGEGWTRFLVEAETVYEPELFSLGNYDNLFGHNGFYTVAQRGSAWTAYDFYYFKPNGDLQMLFAASYPCFIGDINRDGQNELYWGYHGGMELYYTYYNGRRILTLNVVDAIRDNRPAWRNFQGSVFPTDYQGRMSFEISYIDGHNDELERHARLVFTLSAIEFYAED